MSTNALTKEVWGAWLMRGIITILFGIAVVFWPSLTILILVYLFGSFVLVSGIVTAMSGVWDFEHSMTWYLPVALGLFELGVGIYLLRHTSLAFETIILLICFVLIARGVIDGVRVFVEKTTNTSKMFMALTSLFAVVVGIVILFQKAVHGVDFVWLLGLYAIVAGAMQLSNSVHLRHLMDK
jgi:uncharacterized membrane protein HdeD (DUF308 family)